jgi:hypothetical protein
MWRSEHWCESRATLLDDRRAGPIVSLQVAKDVLHFSRNVLEQGLDCVDDKLGFLTRA